MIVDLDRLRFLSNFAKRTFTVSDQVKIINDFLNVSIGAALSLPC